MTSNILKIKEEIDKILNFVYQQEAAYKDILDQVQPHYYESARNLIHYLALRTYDLRVIQGELSMLSISSLGHSEGYTLTNLQNILKLLHLLLNEQLPVFKITSPFDYRSSRIQLEHNTEQLFGQHHQGEGSRIMVTMPTEAANDYKLIRSLIVAGMDIARINTSHETALEWYRMISNINHGKTETGENCLVYMDLAGPKLRTEQVMPLESEKDYLRLPKDAVVFLVKKLPVLEAVAEGEVFISVQLPEIFADAKVGERVYFDDGKIGGKIEAVEPDIITVRITESSLKGSKLRADKGINLPDTNLSIPSLTEIDLVNLPFIAANADIIGYSFARRPSDVERLQQELARLGHQNKGIILKIETKEAFENLPMMLLTAMRSPKIGVMIARGDLAVEIGFERIAEVQEEMLWICEAAHTPGIWATQVLEKLAQKGSPTRAEVTDAAMAARAECVMLNKGPYIVDAVTALDNIILRMHGHQFKRRGNLRPLSVAKKILNVPVEELA